MLMFPHSAYRVMNMYMRRRANIIGLLAVILSLTVPLPCVADEGAAGSFSAMLPRLSIEEAALYDGFDGARSLQFSASGWNVLDDFDRIGVPTNSMNQPWNRGAYTELLRDFESQGLLDSAVYRHSLDDTEFVCLDLRKEDEMLRLTRIRGAIEEGTVFSAEWLQRREAQPLLGLPLESTKLNIETRVGGLKLYGEFVSSNWNSLLETPTGGHGRASASAALQAPGGESLLGPASRPLLTRVGDSVTYELGAKIPLTPDSESRLSFRRGSGSSASRDDEAEELGIEGALRLQEGVKLRAGFAKRTSFSGGGTEGVTEDSVWTGIDIQF